jgi:hypothetical protein
MKLSESSALNKFDTPFFNWRTKMKALMMTLLLMGMSLFPMAQALADGPCSAKAMVGRWVYASGVSQSQQALDPPPPAVTLSSIGTINVDRFGNISGKYDLTVLGIVFMADVTYTGFLTVNPDCTGTLFYQASNGSMRTDSIVVVNRNEMLGMSRDPQTVFTYQVRRISSEPANDDDD